MIARIIGASIGLLLAGSAILQLANLAGGQDLSARPWLDALAVVFLFALGLGLMFTRRCGLWLVALVTFLTFTGYNIHAISVGQASCGCFGVVPATPQVALTIDVVALAGLVVAWVVVDPQPPRGQTVREAATFTAAFGVAAAVWLVPVWLAFGSVPAARAWFRGDSVFLDSTVVEFGLVPVGTTADGVLVVHNAGSSPIRLVGGTADCSCTLLPDLPAIVPSGGVYRLHVQLTVPTGVGHFTHAAKLWTDSETNDLISVTLRGQSVRP